MHAGHLRDLGKIKMYSTETHSIHAMVIICII